jgi:hypothetical protein
LNLLGGHGFGATMTNRRDRLPEGFPGVHMCKNNTEAKSRNSRVAHFNNPTTMVKDFPPTDEMKGSGSFNFPINLFVQYHYGQCSK